MKPRLSLLILFSLMIPPSVVFAQPSPTLQAQREAMTMVAFLEGGWEGSGWMQMGDQRSTFRSSETVESRLDGLALVIEGKHEAEFPGQDAPVLVHHALAMLTYDTESEKYHFNTQVHRGGSGLYQGRVEDGAFIWEMPFGGTRMRYIIRIDDEGRWHEIGQRSDEGENWTKFFEMTLTRVK